MRYSNLSSKQVDNRAQSNVTLLELQLQQVVQRHAAECTLGRNEHGGNDSYSDYNDSTSSLKDMTGKPSALKLCSERTASTSTTTQNESIRSDCDLEILTDGNYEIECSNLGDTIHPRGMGVRSLSQALLGGGLLQSIAKRLVAGNDDDASAMSPSYSGSSASGNSTDKRGERHARSGHRTSKVGQMVTNRRDAKRTALEDKLMQQMADMLKNHQAEIIEMQTKLNQREAAIKTLETALTFRTVSVDELRTELQDVTGQLKKAVKAASPKPSSRRNSLTEKMLTRSSSARKLTARMTRSRSCDVTERNHNQIDDESVSKGTLRNKTDPLHPLQHQSLLGINAVFSSKEENLLDTAMILPKSKSDDESPSLRPPRARLVSSKRHDEGVVVASLRTASLGHNAVISSKEEVILDNVMIRPKTTTCNKSQGLRPPRARLDSRKSDDEGVVASSLRRSSLGHNDVLHSKKETFVDNAMIQSKTKTCDKSQNLRPPRTRMDSRKSDDVGTEAAPLRRSSLGHHTVLRSKEEASLDNAMNVPKSSTCDKSQSLRPPRARLVTTKGDDGGGVVDAPLRRASSTQKPDLHKAHSDRQRNSRSRERSLQKHENSSRTRSMGKEVLQESPKQRERSNHTRPIESSYHGDGRNSSRPRQRSSHSREPSNLQQQEHSSRTRTMGKKVLQECSKQRERSNHTRPIESSNHNDGRPSSRVRERSTHMRSMEEKGHRELPERVERRTTPPVSLNPVPSPRIEKSLSPCDMTRRVPPPTLSKAASNRYMMRNQAYVDLDDEFSR